MYDLFTQGIINNQPALEGLTSELTQRALSHTYFTYTKMRVEREKESLATIKEDIYFLRRLANTLESRAIFDTNVNKEEQQASAFIAAESLSLLANLRSEYGLISENVERIEREEVFVRLESALLYIIAGYDANAGGVIREIPVRLDHQFDNNYKQAQFAASEWVIDLISSLCTFHMNPSPPENCPVSLVDEEPSSFLDLELDVRGRLFAESGEAIGNYMRWLSGDEINGNGIARERLTNLVNRISEMQYVIYADIHHLDRLMLRVLDETENRALINVVPVPQTDAPENYTNYLHIRAKGPQDGSGRPLLWPSTQLFVEECLPGPTRNAVVSMSTGSGKSFLAELAISQILQSGRGWVLYLVPTNALAHQVRRDLRNDLSPLNPDVRAFLGGREYTSLEEESFNEIPENTIVVMTPEKCSLSLRLNPEVFINCALCVFDECHLVANKERGVTAEIVLSQIIVLSPNCCFLLMSAMVQNADMLAEWLHEATGKDSVPVLLNWRPTRSLRCVAGVERSTASDRANLAIGRLNSRPARRVNESFETPYALLAGLRGAWQTYDESDYAFIQLPAQANLRAHRESQNGGWEWEVRAPSWVNESARRIGEMLAEAYIPTLIFLPANKHHPFSVSRRISLSDRLRNNLAPISEKISAYITLSEDELGVPSEIAELLRFGISVHTSLLLETEKFASEEAFRNESSILMLATGTLAQGLNLPAIAVIVGGTRIGFSRDEDYEDVERRKLEQLINASGRSGRAGFANQGLVISIPDQVLYLTGPETYLQAIERIDYITRTDASLDILSPMKSLLDSIAAGRFDPDTASPIELKVTSLLSGGSENAPSLTDVLRCTYAAYLRRREGVEDGAAVSADRLFEIRNQFIEETDSPEWLPIAAQNAGLSFFTTLRLYQAKNRVIPDITHDIYNWDLRHWVDICFQTFQLITPITIYHFFGERSLEKFAPEILRYIKATPIWEQNNPNWEPPEEWMNDWENIHESVLHWINGHTIAEIAAQIMNVDLDEITYRRNTGSSHIPKTLSFIHEIIESLSYLSGGVLAILEKEVQEKIKAGEYLEAQLPYSLVSLPLGIKYGCYSPQILAWYRFGLRLRRPAHLLNRAFPLNPDIEDDHILSETTGELRNLWLNGDININPDLQYEYGDIFESIRTIMET
jgi:hypothetical protein